MAKRTVKRSISLGERHVSNTVPPSLTVWMIYTPLKYKFGQLHQYTVLNSWPFSRKGCVLPLTERCALHPPPGSQSAKSCPKFSFFHVNGICLSPLGKNNGFALIVVVVYSLHYFLVGQQSAKPTKRTKLFRPLYILLKAWFHGYHHFQDFELIWSVAFSSLSAAE